jgi:hypothetical protein
MPGRIASLALLAALALLMAALPGCDSAPTAPPPGPSAPSPSDVCRALTDSLTAAVPPGESQAELQARGIRVRTPLVFAPGAAPRPATPSGAAVRLQIAPDGTVVPGSPKTVKTVGDAQVATAVEAAVLAMNFDIDAASKPTAPVPFTTVYAACLRP